MRPYTDFFKTDTIITPNTICCCDTEVTSYWITKDGEVITYDSSISDEEYNSMDKGACCYLWGCSVDDVIYYGREIEDFKTFIEELENRFIKNKDKDKIKIFIHNLSYEFQVLLRNLYNNDFNSVFARELRKPMKCVIHDTVEFRCSYIMTNLSLASWGKELGLEKKSGEEFNYNKLRSPLTKLTKIEKEYFQRDIEVMIKGVKKLLAEYGTIDKIPLTNTGQVRREFKNIYKKNNNYKHMITRTIPRTKEEYLIRKETFNGGDTHACIVNVGKVCKDVASFDRCSSYLGVLFSYKYPRSAFVKVDENQPMNFEKYSYIMLLQIKNLRMKKGCTLSYISSSRCVSVTNGIYDNGRILKADAVVIYCTHYDYLTMQRIYDAEFNILTLRRSINAYIDKEGLMLMLDYFNKKTTLKGIAGKEDLYMKSKNRLNAGSFGMMVQDIIQPIIKFNGDWQAEGQLTQDITQALAEKKKKFWNNYFSYDIGIFITAIARFELWKAILSVADAEHDFRYNNDVVYFDTDSVKFKNYKKHKKTFEKLNEEILQANKRSCDYYGLDYEVFQPKKPNGKKSVLGLWEFEEIYTEFKTLGAKKYAYKDDEGIHITVSGVPKRASKCLNSLEDFTEGFIFDRDICRKGLSTYLDGNNPIVTLKDGYTVNQPFTINIRNIGYKLGITNEFREIIDFMVAHGEI